MSHTTYSETFAPTALSADSRGHIAFQAWAGAELSAGHGEGTRYRRGGVVLTEPIGSIPYTDPIVAHAAAQEFEYGRWTTPEVSAPFGFTDLIASWHASTPEGTWIEIATQVRGVAGTSSWLTLARWAEDDSTVHPASMPGQREITGRVSTDAWLAAEGNRGLWWRLRVTLLRPAGTVLYPTLRYLGAMVSVLPAKPPAPSKPGPTVGQVLDVPAYSQRLHAGQYPHWDGGGDSWCSPTSTSMVMRYWTDRPRADEYDWVEPHYLDRHIHHAVRHCFDYSYAGAGNWSFNTAYAARYGLIAFVTRLRDLTEAEEFIAAGIPLVASIQVASGELDGAGYTASGHLLVIVGFTTDGNVVCHDPAASDNASVRRIYRREQLERAWLGASGGIVYVICRPDTPLPPRKAEANW